VTMPSNGLKPPFGLSNSRVRVYQALLKANEPAIPHREIHQSPGQAAIDQRMAYFAAKATNCTRLMSIGSSSFRAAYAKSTLWEALRKVPTDIGGSLRDVLALFSRDQQAVSSCPYRARPTCCFRQKVSGLIGQLSDLVEIQLQGAEECLPHTAALHQFRPLKILCSHLAGSRYLDFQLCDSELEAHRGHAAPRRLLRQGVHAEGAAQ